MMITTKIWYFFGDVVEPQFQIFKTFANIIVRFCINFPDVLHTEYLNKCCNFICLFVFNWLNTFRILFQTRFTQSTSQMEGIKQRGIHVECKKYWSSVWGEKIEMSNMKSPISKWKRVHTMEIRMRLSLNTQLQKFILKSISNPCFKINVSI